MNKMNVCVVTGSRAEYGSISLLLKKIEASDRLNLILIVSGAHLLERFGKTIDDIKKDGIPINEVVPIYDENDISREAIGKAVGRGIIKFTEILSKYNPDLLLIAGDRFEIFAAVIAAASLAIPIAHIHGGDSNTEGQIDEQIRHAITKMAHIHFPATPLSSRRIRGFGEEEWRINMVGSPSIDMVYKEQLYNKEDIVQWLGFNPSKKIGLCVQHPYTFDSDLAGTQMNITLSVLKDLDFQTVIVYPNNDPGNQLIINEIEKFRDTPNFKIFKNLKRICYLSLFKNVDLLIGNSSSGIIESPIFKLPVVNIGNRNKGRESAENVINVPHKYSEIKKAIIKATSDEFIKTCKEIINPYGDGKASERIVKILENLKLQKRILIKKLDYDF